MQNVSFQAIRNLVASQSVAQVTAQVSEKAAETANAIGSAIKGIMPVTQSQMDHNMKALLNLIHAQGIDLALLRSEIGFGNAPDVNQEMLAQLTHASMQAIKGKPLQTAPVPVQSASVLEEDVVLQLPVESQTNAPVKSSEAAKPLDSLRTERPSNWYMGPLI